jgi:tRNA (adenine57-N1/adenine58-N1)-methyltransferase
MTAHTGFLIFARKQKRSDAFDALRPKGTRERKQESARQKRLAEHSAEESAAPGNDCEQDME